MKRMPAKKRWQAYVPRTGRRRRRPASAAIGEKTLAVVGGLFILLLFILLIRTIFSGTSNQKYILAGDVAAFRIPPSALSAIYTLSEKYGVPYTELLAVYAIDNSFFPQKEAVMVDEAMLEKQYIMKLDQLKKQYPESDYAPYYQIIRDVFSTVERFPVPQDYTAEDYMYGDSFGTVVDYDGKGTHYGADIMDRENMMGRMAVLAIADGTVEESGWSQALGYFVNIRCQNGVRYQYARMALLAAGLNEGAMVMAGQTIGALGNTGGGKQEGTTDGGPVRLHVAIAPETSLGDKPFWFNPYPVLRFAEAAAPK